MDYEEIKDNKAGWIFMDYRNSAEVLDRNTIIYGHGKLDTAMFRTLKNILKTSWVNKKDNYIVKLSTFKENMLFQVFSVYQIPVETNYIKINLKTKVLLICVFYQLRRRKSKILVNIKV